MRSSGPPSTEFHLAAARSAAAAQRGSWPLFACCAPMRDDSMRRLVVVTAMILAIGCASRPVVQSAAGTIRPYDAIQMAASNPERGVVGVFELTVRGVGRDDALTLLNSEVDYRDQRCLTVAMGADAAADLGAALGAPVDVALVGRTIAVTGTARRVRIDFYGMGNPTGKYYYQTQIRVTHAAQIQVM